MESKADLYRRRAEEARAMAGTTGDLSAKMYNEISEHDRYLGEQQDLVEGCARRSGK